MGLECSDDILFGGKAYHRNLQYAYSTSLILLFFKGTKCPNQEYNILSPSLPFISPPVLTSQSMIVLLNTCIGFYVPMRELNWNP